MHRGGLEKHEYQLEMHGCAESMPVQCEATVNDLTFGACESFVSNKIVFNLKDDGIDGAYSANGSPQIKGATNTSAVVTLPNFSGKAPRTALPPSVPSAPGQKHVVCVTHTNSDLSINAASTDMTLTTTDGQKHTFAILGTDVAFIEMMPSIQETPLGGAGKVYLAIAKNLKTVGAGIYVRDEGVDLVDLACVRT